MPTSCPIAADALLLPVDGINLPDCESQTFGAVVGRAPTLVVFLRHFGCVFCREMVKDVRKASTNIPGYPRVMFVYQGTVEDGMRFFDRFWPDAIAVADPQRRLYDLFSLQRGTASQLFGPSVWGCAVRATVKGNTIGIGRVIGDPFVMPGVFYVRDQLILWRHDFLHAGDHPDWARLPVLLDNPSIDPGTCPQIS